MINGIAGAYTGGDQVPEDTLNPDKPVSHPAKFSASVYETIKDWVRDELPRERKGSALGDFPSAYIFDPFAGIGRIHQLMVDFPDVLTWGTELELEWAHQSEHTDHYDALLAEDIFNPGFFDAIITSPCYGNRMADHHNARDASVRNTYRHKLGRPLTAGSSAGMQWGREYREFHARAWVVMNRLVRHDGWFVLNISNHIRDGEEMHVSEWHAWALTMLGWNLQKDIMIETPRLRHGENHAARVAYEHVMIFRAGKVEFFQTELDAYTLEMLATHIPPALIQQPER